MADVRLWLCGIFILTQMHGLGWSRLVRWLVAGFYVAAALLIYSSWGWMQLNEIIRIPVIEYLLVFVLAGLIALDSGLPGASASSRTLAIDFRWKELIIRKSRMANNTPAHKWERLLFSSHCKRIIMMNTLSGKVAVITGASRGLGRAIAMLFAREGAKVVLAARSQKDIDQNAAEFRAGGHQAVSFVCDVSDPGPG